MKKFVSVFISVILIVAVLPISNFNVFALVTGDFGDNVSWVFDSSTKTLTVSGQGDMSDYNAVQSFSGKYKEIQSIIINDGVTSIGEMVFGICEKVSSISIPLSVKRINSSAFENCSLLKNVYYAGTEAEWKEIVISEVGNGYLLKATKNYKEEPHECEFGEWKIVNEPTCVSDGLKIQYCKDENCDNTNSESIPATGVHSFQWKTVHEASCTENGEERQFCKICNTAGEWKIVNKLGHKSSDWSVQTEATCSNSGFKVKKCEICGEVLQTESISKLSHNFSDWKTEIKATETREGIETRTCKSCKLIVTRKIEKLPSTDKSLLGDVNGDGNVMATDARLVLQVVAGLKNVDKINFKNADVNNDSFITAVDARLILQIVAGIK